MNSNIHILEEKEDGTPEREISYPFFVDVEMAEENVRNGQEQDISAELVTMEVLNPIPFEPHYDVNEVEMSSDDENELETSLMTTAAGASRNSADDLRAEGICELEEDGSSVAPSEISANREDLIRRLMDDGMSFKEVVSYWGDEGDSDVEDAAAREDHAAAFDREISDQQRFNLKGKRPGERRRRRRLPAALEGLMGEANLRYARREYDDAIKMCMEMIRQYPHSPQPYQTLAMIYEEKEMMQKSMQFLLIAAFLSPTSDEWEKLAYLSLNDGDLTQAVFCLGRAIKADPQNLDFHWSRCDLLEQLGERNKALRGYTSMLRYLRPEQGQEGLKLAKGIAKLHYENKDLPLAKEALETALERHAQFVNAEYVNLLCEVLLALKLNVDCVKVVTRHSGVMLIPEEMDANIWNKFSIEEQLTNAVSCQIPSDLILDLRVKLIVALIGCRSLQLVNDLQNDLMKKPVEEFGEFYLEVAEAYMTATQHTAALQLLEPLIHSNNFSLAATWLLYGECLAAVERLEEAVEAYKQVVHLAPGHADARLTLSSILQSLGRQDEALRILTQEQSGSELLNSRLLYRHCQLLLEQERLDEFVEVTKLLFRRHFVTLRNQEEVGAVIKNKRMSSKYEALRETRRFNQEPIDEQGPSFTGIDVPIEDQWTLFKKTCDILYQTKRLDELERLTFSALGSKEFARDRDRTREIEFLCLLACVYNESSFFAFNIARDWVVKRPDQARCWNLLNVVISRADDFRHSRFLLRLSPQHPDSVALGLLNGHNCLVAGTYKYALAEYSHVLLQEPTNPLAHLLLGLTYTHLACQKFSGRKHALVAQSCAFLHAYQKNRGPCQEVWYNLGRTMHQLNLLPQAVHYYKRALACPPPAQVPEGTPTIDLTREIAYNLSLVYQSSGAMQLARMYLYKYIQV